MEHLHETPLQGIVGTDKGELFYLLPIEKVSDLVKLRGGFECGYRPDFKDWKFRRRDKCHKHAERTACRTNEVR